MLKIQNFKATNQEFKAIVKIYNLISHDDIADYTETKNRWKIRDKTLKSDKLLLYYNNKVIGYLAFVNGRNENSQTFFFNILLDPKYSNLNYREKLYQEMLLKINNFRVTKIHSDVWEHKNYKSHHNFLIKHSFKCVQTNKESFCKIKEINLDNYRPLIKKLERDGIKLFDSKYELNKNSDHYKKLEELSWQYAQDFPIPDGISHTREPFKQFLKEQIYFESNEYGIELVAVKNNKYIAATDISVNHKSQPSVGWTGSLGVLREYRRKGIATALKVKAIDLLIKKGITEIRTDNEENNPMYQINIKLGFKPAPSQLDYLKVL